MRPKHPGNFVRDANSKQLHLARNWTTVNITPNTVSARYFHPQILRISTEFHKKFLLTHNKLQCCGTGSGSECFRENKAKEPWKNYLFFICFLSVTDEKKQDPDPDLYQNATDPQHCWAPQTQATPTFQKYIGSLAQILNRPPQFLILNSSMPKSCLNPVINFSYLCTYDLYSPVQCCGSRSGAFLTPGSGIPGSRTQILNWPPQFLILNSSVPKSFSSYLAPVVVGIVGAEPQMEFNLMVLGAEENLLHQSVVVAHRGRSDWILHTHTQTYGVGSYYL